MSNLIDLNTGDISAGDRPPAVQGAQPSPRAAELHDAADRFREAAVYPGFLNRRVRWDKNSRDDRPASRRRRWKRRTAWRSATSRPCSKPSGSAPHPLAPREAVVPACSANTSGRIGDRHVVLEDASGTRIEAADRRKDYSNTANLVRAMGMLGTRQAGRAGAAVRPADDEHDRGPAAGGPDGQATPASRAVVAGTSACRVDTHSLRNEPNTRWRKRKTP